MATAKLDHDVLKIPYIGKLDGALVPGQSVVVQGRCTAPETFTISLAVGPRPEQDDVPFQMSVRLKDKSIHLNSFKGGKPEKEEKKKCPFKQDQNFAFRIRCHDSKFEIWADHKELANFEYRQPLSNIRNLVIEGGGIELHELSWGGKYYPVPYEATIDGGIGPGKKLTISGVPEAKKAKRFFVNLKARNGDIALHFNPRFDEKVVVRNAEIGKAWQAEEREGKMPFEKDIAFDLVIKNEQYAFQIFINGTHFCSFAHRVDPNTIVGLEIGGDVELQIISCK